LYEIFSAEFKRKTGIDITPNKRSVVRLQRESEKVKRNLSRAQQAQIQIDGLSEGMDYTTTISRARFEDLADIFFRNVINFITTSLGDIPKQSIDDIILIGGCSQIPRLKQMITNYFEKEPMTNVNQDDAACLGNSFAAKCFDRDNNVISPIKKTTLPIGIEGNEGKFIPIIPKNSPLPVKITKTFSIPPDGQIIKILIHEGENDVASLNKLLYQFSLNLSDFTKNEVISEEHVRLTFLIQPDGNFHIKASTTNSTHTKTFKLTKNEEKKKIL